MNFTKEMDFYTKSSTNNNGFIDDMDTKFFTSLGIICAYMDLILDKIVYGSYENVDINSIKIIIDSYKNDTYQLVEKIMLGGRIILQAGLIKDEDFDRIMHLISKNVKLEEIDDIVSIIKNVAFPELNLERK